MSTVKTHTGTIITKDGKKRVKLTEKATTWHVKGNESYDKFTGRRAGAPLTSRRLILTSIKAIEEQSE